MTNPARQNQGQNPNQEQIKQLQQLFDSKLNRSDISRTLNIDVAHVSRIFSGQSNPSITVARRLTAYLKQNGFPEMTTDLLCDVLGINGFDLRNQQHKEGNDGHEGKAGSPKPSTDRV